MFADKFSIFTSAGNNAEKTKQRHKEQKEEDERFLQKIGYRQELYRGFSPFMSFAFCFTSVNVLTAISIGFADMLSTGGSGVTIWAWIIASFFTILISLSLAEICSVYPSAGSVYHWCGKLVSPRYAPLASFVCGWFNFIGNVAGDAAFSSSFATMVNAALVLDGNSPLSTEYQVGIGIAIIFIWSVLNTLRIDKQGWLNNVAAFLQISSTVTIVIVLLVMAPQRASAKNVFTSTYNGTGFSLGYIYCLGILPALFSFSGYEAGAHLSEETRGASRAAPRSIVATCVFSAVIGVVYLLALLFVIPNVTTFMNAHSDDNKPINLAVATFQFVLPHQCALAFTILLIINICFAGMASVTATTRIGFAMARDSVFPFSNYLRWIFQRTKIPLANLLLVFIIDCLLILLQLVSTTAFYALVSMSSIGLQVSYLMPIIFRCTTARDSFELGEFNLGRLSLPVAIISCIWLFITIALMFFPFQYPVTKDNMNYAIVIMSGFGLVPVMYWLISARHWYVGPKRPDINPIPLSTIHAPDDDDAASTAQPPEILETTM